MSDTGQYKDYGEYKEPGTQGGGPKPKKSAVDDLNDELAKWQEEGIHPGYISVNGFIIDCRLAALWSFLVEKGIIDLEEFKEYDARFMTEQLQIHRPNAIEEKRKAIAQRLMPQPQEVASPILGPDGKAL